MVCRCISATKNPGLRESHARRDLVAEHGFRIPQFRAGAKQMTAHDRVADSEAGHLRPYRDDMAGRLAAGDERWFRTKLIFSFQHQHIHLYRTPRAADADLDFAWTWRWRI